MRIAVFNWRDIKNPKHGGAEIVTHEYAKGWVKAGHEVLIICPAFPGGKSDEVIDRVRYKRLGLKKSWNYLLIHFLAFGYYLRQLKGKIDLVVDEIHGIPFFTPLYVKEKKLAFICEVAGEIWDIMYPKPVAIMGKFIEDIYFRFYKKTRFLTISQATKSDLLTKGIPKIHIEVINPGINHIKMKIADKNKTFTILWLNRICRMKNLKDGISAFGMIQTKIKNSRMVVAGKPDDPKYYKECKEYAEKIAVEDKINFVGFIEESVKLQLMAESYLMIHTSTKEGWGLNILEANICGTPAVVYNTAGLTETVRNGETGIICKQNTPGDLSAAAYKLYKDKILYRRMRKKSANWANTFSWEKSIHGSLKFINSI